MYATTTVLYHSFGNFACVYVMAWRYESVKDEILRLSFFFLFGVL